MQIWCYKHSSEANILKCMMDTRISSRLFMLAFCRILIQVSRTVGNHLKTFNELLFLKHLQRAKSGVYLEFPVITVDWWI